MEGFTCRGVWWLPKQEEDRLSGTVTFDPDDGLTLDLIGAFGGFESLTNGPCPEIVLGTTTDGKDFTLYGCLQKSSGFSSGGLFTSVFFSRLAIVGHHFQQKDDIILDKYHIRYSYLEDWLCTTGMAHEQKFAEDGGMREFRATYRFPDIKPLNIKDHTLRFCHECHISFPYYQGLTLEENALVAVTPNQPTCLISSMEFIAICGTSYRSQLMRQYILCRFQGLTNYAA